MLIFACFDKEHEVLESPVGNTLVAFRGRGGPFWRVELCLKHLNRDLGELRPAKAGSNSVLFSLCRNLPLQELRSLLCDDYV